MNESFLEFTKDVALTAGKYALENFGIRHRSIEKESNHSIVTKIDIETERIIVNLIKDNYSNHNLLSEELGWTDNNSIYTWIIDPLDGSSYYSRAIDTFSVSIALFCNMEPLLGVVYCPVANELFYSEKGKGAFLNGDLIRCSEISLLRDSIGSFGHRYLRLDIYEPISKVLLESVRSLRAGGSCAMELCYLACGRIDILVAVNQSIWDYAAGMLIVRESGCQFKEINDKSIDLNILLKNKLDFISFSQNLDLNLIFQPKI